jgi:predicted ribosomally synthesized peptide with nif11-like leader
MSEDQLKAFLVKAVDDPALQEKIKASVDPDAFLALAKDEGFVISAEIFSSLFELSDDQLSTVAGGGGQSFGQGLEQFNAFVDNPNSVMPQMPPFPGPSATYNMPVNFG